MIASRSIAIEIALRTLTFEKSLSYVGNARNVERGHRTVLVAVAEVGCAFARSGVGTVAAARRACWSGRPCTRCQILVDLEVDAADLRLDAGVRGELDDVDLLVVLPAGGASS